MKIIECKLNIHTPWYICPKTNDDDDSLEALVNHMKAVNYFQCGDICNLGISNDGSITIKFNEEKQENEVRELTAILIYFISVCNGFNCQYHGTAIIDGLNVSNFFDYAKEDNCDVALYKNYKFYQLSLEEIKEEFGNILYRLFTLDRRLILALLSNYYSMVVYKDFIGNGEYKFRNIVTNMESLITLINKEKYSKVKNNNKLFIDKLSDDCSISKNQVNKYILPKSVTLEEKLEDVFEYFKQDGLIFKLQTKKECTKIANTRNFISHLFDSKIDYLTRSEISKYTSIFEELFRMIFLEYIGVPRALVLNKFLINEPIRETLQSVFQTPTK